MYIILIAYLTIGLVSSLFGAYKLIKMSYTSFNNWWNIADSNVKLGLIILMFINIFAWPIIFIILGSWIMEIKL